MIGRAGGAELAGSGVDLELRGVGAHLLLGEPRAARVGEVAVGDELQSVAGRADLGVDLQPALQLRLVEDAERSLEGEGEVGDMLRRRAAGGQGWRASSWTSSTRPRAARPGGAIAAG